MADPHVITLRRPVGPKGHEIMELRLREPTAGEVLRSSREIGRGLALTLLQQVTGADIAAIEALPGRVSDKALGYLMTFVEPILTDMGAGTEDPADEMIIDLDETLQAGTTWVTKLDLREPTLGELIKGDKYEGMQRTVVLVALVSGLPRAIVEMLPISAFAKAASFVMGFTGAAPAIGG